VHYNRALPDLPTIMEKSIIMKTVCVIGLGYTGLPTAAMFATHGCQVIGVDINP